LSKIAPPTRRRDRCNQGGRHPSTPYKARCGRGHWASGQGHWQCCSKAARKRCDRKCNHRKSPI